MENIYDAYEFFTEGKDHAGGKEKTYQFYIQKGHEKLTEILAAHKNDGDGAIGEIETVIKDYYSFIEKTKREDYLHSVMYGMFHDFDTGDLKNHGEAEERFGLRMNISFTKQKITKNEKEWIRGQYRMAWWGISELSRITKRSKSTISEICKSITPFTPAQREQYVNQEIEKFKKGTDELAGA